MHKKKKQSMGEAVAVGSAIAGAALGAAAVYLSDKKNQEKIKKTIDEVSDEAVKIGKNIRKKAEEYKIISKKDEKKVKKTVIVARKSTKKTTTPKVYTPKK